MKIILIGLFFLACQVKAQIDYKHVGLFTKHLNETGFATDATNYLNGLKINQYNQTKLDSHNLQLAYAYFYKKDFETSSRLVSELKIQNQNTYLLNGICLLNAKLYKEGIDKLVKCKEGNQLCQLALYGSRVLMNSEIDSLMVVSINYPYHVKGITQALGMLSSRKSKSPVIAALMSAFIPGSGKIYGGKIGEGVAAFASVGVLAGATLEQYFKGGLKNPQLYLIGIPALIFYGGNIYGSYFSVEVANYEFNETIHNEVLFNINIPFTKYLSGK